VESRDKITAALDDFKRAMGNANLVLEKGIVLLNNSDSTLFSLRQHLLVTAQNMESTSENLNRLSDLLAAQPSQLFFREPPPPRKIEPEVNPR
jgi:hypothetical protein